jgi:hypothetical protein
VFFAQSQRSLTFRLPSFVPRGRHSLLLFARQSRVALSRFWRFGSLSSLFSCFRDRCWYRPIFDFAHDRGCRNVPDQRMTAHQRHSESGGRERVRNDDAAPPRPTLPTFAVQQSVVSCSLLRIAKDSNCSCDLAEPPRGIRIARVEVRMMRLSCSVIRLAQGLIVSIRMNIEQIIKCSHRYAFEERPAKNDVIETPRILPRQGVAAKPDSR